MGGTETGKVVAFRRNKAMVRKSILTLVLLGLLVASLGCNTFRGLGRDISNAGDAITQAAGGAP
jgi:predicted small secreted protein